MQSREAKVVMVPLTQLIDMVVREAQRDPGAVLPDPVPKIETANFNIENNHLKCVLTFREKDAGLSVMPGSPKGILDA